MRNSTSCAGAAAGEMGLGTGVNLGHVVGMNPVKTRRPPSWGIVIAEANEFFHSRTSNHVIRDVVRPRRVDGNFPRWPRRRRPPPAPISPAPSCNACVIRLCSVTSRQIPSTSVRDPTRMVLARMAMSNTRQFWFAAWFQTPAPDPPVCSGRGGALRQRIRAPQNRGS